MGINQIKLLLEKTFPESLIIVIKQTGLPNFLMFVNKIIIGIYLLKETTPIMRYYIDILEQNDVKIIINKDIDIVKKEIKSIIKDRSNG